MLLICISVVTAMKSVMGEGWIARDYRNDRKAIFQCDRDLRI